MTELNFSNIRTFDGSKDGGFEELICQLAHLCPPSNARIFERKEGAGGDAGVECYWMLGDGTEHAWQAKYFLESIDDSQWTQISDSVLTALDKHPNITNYYVCIPQDLPDSRKMGRGGKQVLSARDKWNTHCNKWEKEALKRNMQVNFHFWGKHELLLMLSQRDNSLFNGRARYWFDELILTKDIFEKIINRSRLSLGDRFTPEFHVDLPIAKIFDGLGRTKEYTELLSYNVYEWLSIVDEVEKALLRLENCDKNYFKDLVKNLSYQDKWNLITTTIENLKNSLKYKDWFSKLEIYISVFGKIQEFCSELIMVYHSASDYKKTVETVRIYQNDIYKFSDITTNLLNFFTDKTTQAAYTRQLLLHGDAGNGKSHMLCDIALTRMGKGLSTVFMLGQHYQGGNPLDFLKRELDLASIDDSTLLGALDACGEADKSNLLIIIDAINEGRFSRDWNDWLISFFHQISQYPHISIVVSCRSTYVNYVFPEDLRSNITQQEHNGFKGFEHRAASIYLNRQGIVKPSVPILAPEYTNPLFLKTCCKAIKQAGLSEFPKGLHGIVNIFEFYIQSAQNKISKVKGYRPHEKVIYNALLRLAEKIFPENVYGLKFEEAFELINSVDSRNGSGEYLYDLMLEEGLISEDIEYNRVDGQTNSNVVVRFTFERFSDYLIAISIMASIQSIPELEAALYENYNFQLLKSKQNSFKFLGIWSALNIIIADKFKTELIDHFPIETLNYYFFEETFVKTLISRSTSSFTDRTIEIFHQIPNKCYEDHRINILFALATEPTHKLNAIFLNDWLKNMSLSSRDSYWSTYVAYADEVEEEHETESNLRALIEWALSKEIALAEEERLYLCSIALTWITSTTNRKLRDEVTKAVAHLLCFIPEKIILFLENFYEINDPYINERVYAIVYGVLINLQNNSYTSKISQWIFEHHFKDKYPYPHILLRDYIVSILLYAEHTQSLPTDIKRESFLPPYKQKWSLKDPIHVLNIADQDKNEIYYSVMSSMSDFYCYSMRAIDEVTCTELDMEDLRVGLDEKIKFAKDLPEPLAVELEALILEEADYLLLKKLEESKLWRSFNSDKILEEIFNNRTKQITLDPNPEANEIINFDTNNKKNEKTKIQLFLENNKNKLSPLQQVKAKWIFKLPNHEIVMQSKKQAQRWIYFRAMQLGWSDELFKSFDRNLSSNGGSRPLIERIGKKYQWIAYHEYLAYLTDSFQVKPDSNFPEAISKDFIGSWQLDERDIDPTLLIRRTGDDGWLINNKTTWWQPISINFAKSDHINELQEWLWTEKNIPQFNKALIVKDECNINWYALAGFVKFKKQPKLNKDKIPYQDFWYRINPVIISSQYFSEFKQKVVGQELCNPDLIETLRMGYHSFLGEHCWHPCVYDYLNDLSEGFGSRLDHIDENLEAFSPISKYEYEGSTKDASVQDGINFFLPSPKFIHSLDLKRKALSVNNWVDSLGRIVFQDPSVDESGSSFALCRKDILDNWLEVNNYRLIWLIGGDKKLFTEFNDKFYGRLNFNGFFVVDNQGIDGSMWATKTKPEEDK